MTIDRRALLAGAAGLAAASLGPSAVRAAAAPGRANRLIAQGRGELVRAVRQE